MVHIAGRSRWLAAVLATFVGLNTVVLAFVGNTVPDRNDPGGHLRAPRAGCVAARPRSRLRVAARSVVRAGLPLWSADCIAGWLIMLNPYAFVLGVGLWVAVRLVVLVRLGD